MKNQKGITLVALVITIIVMLILVAVTVAVAFGENGLINRAREAGEEQKNQQHYENNVLPGIIDNVIANNVP